MRLFSLDSLRTKLIILVLIAVLPLFGLTIYAGLQERDRLRDHGLGEALSRAKNIAISLEQLLERTRQSLFVASQMLEGHEHPRHAIEKVLRKLSLEAPELSAILVSDPTGNLMASTYATLPKSNLSSLPSFQKILQTKKFVIGEYQASIITNKPVLTLGYPARDRTGRVEKVIFAKIDLEQLAKLMGKHKLPPTARLSILDHEGTVLFRIPAEPQFLGKKMPRPDMFKRVLAEKEGVIGTKGRDGVNLLYGFTTIGGDAGSLFVAVGLPTKAAYAAVEKATYRHLLWLVVVSGIVILFAWFGGDFFIIRKLNGILGAAEQVRGGNLQARVGGHYGKGEIGQLSYAFDEMVEALQERETERVLAVQLMQESEVKLRTIFESSVDAIGVSKSGIQTFMNPAYLSLFGYSNIDELINQPVLMLIAPSEREIILERIKSHAKGEVVLSQYETQGLRKDGTEFDMDVHVSTYELGGETYTLVVLRDISDLKRAEDERRMMEERLLRSEKMEALGKLAGGVAHDLNNVLGVLSGYSELLLEWLPEGSPLKEYAANILKSTEKGAAIIQDLLTLARRGVVVSKVIDLNGVVSSLITTPEFKTLRSYHPQVTIKTDLERDLLNINGSPVHLEKMLLNLVSNAAEAILNGGEVMIRTENRYLDKAIRGYDQVEEGDYVVLTLSDSGGGIPAADLDKIFEPFYTKKSMGRSGTGLGLAIVWGTVKDHNGYIDVQSTEGEGTTFTLYFPATREKIGEEAQKIPVEQYMGHGESVLVVDDVEAQRQVATTLLGRLGYQVRAVASGEEAIEYLKSNKADIMILDMIMPGIDGLETYQKIISFNPKQKAIIVSGFSETERVDKAKRLSVGAYVKKPYVMEKIGVAIRDELARK